MKGQTIIELKDVNTGKIERYIDNNMMTEAIEDIFKTRGLMVRNSFTQTNLVKACLGGILLFDDELIENTSNVFPPTDVNMVGNAAMDIVSTDSVIEMGSYNSNESGWQQDGSFLAVYDFLTSQANGTIACVCLTSDLGGYIGFGNGISNARKSTARNIYGYGGAYDTNYGMSGYSVARVDYTNSTVDLIPVSNTTSSSADYFGKTKKLKIEKYKIPLSKINLQTTPTSFKKVSEVEVDLPGDVTLGSECRVTVDDDGNIYLYPISVGTWATSQTYNFVKVSNQNVASKVSLINTTGVNINLNLTWYFVFSGNYVCLLHESIRNVYRFNMLDSSSIEIQNVDTTYLNGSNIALNKGGYVFFATKVLNIEEGWIRYHNGTGESGVYFNASGHPLITSKRQVGQVMASIHAMYLASINNLDAPVVKTAEKTMKISYRIMF